MIETKQERFDEQLNDSYPAYDFGWGKYYPADILKSVDPIAYRVALADYEDGEEIE